MQPLTLLTLTKNMRKFPEQIQAAKVRVSKQTIRKLQTADKFPEDYVSYVTSVTAKNRTDNPDRFFSQMLKHPKFYDKDFWFFPVTDQATMLKDASIEASKLVRQQAQRFNPGTGLYLESFKPFINGSPMRSFAELDAADSSSIFELTNSVEYAGAAEVNALFYAKFGGVLYYAAKRIQRKYPSLSVSFGYIQSNAFGMGHKYTVPVLSIGARDAFRSEITRPGSNRKKHRRKQARLRSQVRSINRRFGGG